MKTLGVNGTFLPGDANLIIPSLSADVMVVDPPREGLQRSTIMALLESKIQEIIYLSCDLKSGSRDCLALLKKYEILQIYPFQFFPQTFNFETLIHLRLRPTPLTD
jgi:23S rRNA (uracil1939-C5)-methyltransferase